MRDVNGQKVLLASALVIPGLIALGGEILAGAAEEPPVLSPTVQEAPAAVTPPATQEDLPPAADAGDVQERAIIRDHRTQPGTFTPSQITPLPFGQPAPKMIVPGITGPATDAMGQRPTTAAPDNRYVAPTQNLTLVANALRLNYKSLTTFVTIPQGLPVTQPVEVSIGYYSPAGLYGPGFQRMTQSYVRSAGNRFLNNDPEGDGKVRRMRVDISLRESNPGGQPVTFSFSWQVDLDPLYDVAISPLHFSLSDNCDIAGNSEIRFVWWAPDDPSQTPHTFNFSTQVSRSTVINQFAWARQEVSALNNLRQLYFYFWEKDTIHPTFGFRAPGGGAVVNNLVPGKTKVVEGNLTDEASSNKQDCRAYFEYTITYTLRLYPYL